MEPSSKEGLSISRELQDGFKSFLRYKELHGKHH